MGWKAFLGVGIMGLAMLVGTSEGGGQAKKEKEGKIKGFLPQGWKDLNLSAAQKEKVYETQAKYKAKIDALDEQKKVLKQEEKADLVKILTDDQRELLRKLTIGEGPKKKDDKRSDK